MSTRFRRLLLPVGFILTAIVVAGCGGKSSSAPPTALSTVTSAASPVTIGPKPVVAAGTNAKLGQILVDARGFTLYYDASEKGGTIVCTGGCTSVWPPLLLPAGLNTPSAATPLPGTLATVARPDGATQVTYNGMPLYRFANDRHPGDATGQGVANFFVIQVRALSPATTAATTIPAALPTTVLPASPATRPPATSPPTTPRMTSPPTAPRTTSPPVTSPPTTSPPTTPPPTTRPPTTPPTTTCPYPPCY